MRLQEYLVRATHKAFGDVCRAALAIPEDRRTWVPMGEARSVLDQMQEVAISPLWFSSVLEQRKAPDEDGESVKETVAKAKGLATVEECIAMANAGTADLCRLIADFPDADLEREVTMPFGGGISMAFSEVLALHAWNLNYHLGQLNYIQLMLGDKAMH